MANIRIDKVSPDKFRWAFKRAGYNEEKATEVFPLLSGWLSKDKLPTLRQLEKFANKFHVPLGYLFLDKTPAERIPIPVFRGTGGKTDKFDLNLYDTINTISYRQDWLADYLPANEILTSKMVGCVNLRTPINEAVDKLRNGLGLTAKWAFSYKTPDAAVNILTEHIEDAGVFVAFNGVVANNTHRKLRIDVCRGFALVNRYAPYIFVNSDDSKSAQLFTLVHEMAHIMLGVSAGHAGEEIGTDDITELFCDKVAAEFLVPASEIRLLWDGDTKRLSHMFKASEVVVARRAHDLGLLSDDAYRKFWLAYSNRTLKERKQGSGGDFFRTSVKRVGRLFAIHVRNAVNSRQMTYLEAYRLTGLHGDTYQKFMTNNI